jgi:hypothetical protein
MPPASEIAKWRFVWKLVFKVCGEQPSMTLTLEIWNIETVTMIGREVVSLSPVDQRNVGFTNDTAVFKDGYLQYKLDLNQASEDLLNRLFPGNGSNIMAGLAPAATALHGENVSIAADIKTDPADGSQFPIFHMGQPSTNGILPAGTATGGGTDAVSLVEEVRGTDRNLLWSISGPPPYEARLQPYVIDPNVSQGGWHTVRVRHDIAPLPDRPFTLVAGGIPDGLEGPLYEWLLSWLHLFPGYGIEFLVGGLQLGDAVPDRNGQTHYFEAGAPVDFYIGGVPTGPGATMGLTGEISYLEFDPKQVCGGCVSMPVPTEQLKAMQ